MKLEDLNPKHREEAMSQMAKKPYDHTPLTPARLSDALTKHFTADESLAADAREEMRRGRFEVRIIRRSTNLLDKDNLYGGVKFACDALRYAKLIREDDPESIELIVTQEKVKTRKEIGTIIEITPL